MKRWKQFKQVDRMRSLFVSVALTIGFYGLVIYPSLQEALNYSESMISRRLDRIEKRAETDKELEGNPAPLYKELNDLKQEFKLIDLQRQQAEQKFVSLIDYDAQQQLQLEIVNLARQTGVRLEKISKPESNDNVVEASDEASERNYLPRSLMKLDAKADYWSLVHFIEGLQSLSYYTAVVKLKIVIPRSLRSKQTSKDTSSNGLLIHLVMIL